MTIRLNRWHLVLLTVLWEGAFLALSASQFNDFQVLNVFGFLTLILLPGLLTMIMLRLDNLSFWAHIGLTAGFSILELMSIALVGNTFLPYADLDIARPLDQPVLLMEFTTLVHMLLVVCWEFSGDVMVTVRRFVIFDTMRDAVFALTPLLFVILSVVGAIRLNNGADGTLTLVMLIGLGLYSGILVWQGKKFGENVMPTALFFMALALLFMTSLRGWYIIGHDIQREYSVFQLTQTHGIWNIALYRDAYNACMSIVMLPTIFSNLLNLPNPYVYKILFQIIFAIVPAVLFLSIRRYVSVTVAFLSALYFISFPTFFGDMPFLNRQEIAFFFFVLMLYVLSERYLYAPIRQILFVVFGIGMVLSHYTTTYTVVAFLLFLLLARPLTHRLGGRLARIRLFRDSALAGIRDATQPKAFVAAWMVVTIALASFLWSSVLTDTASESLYRVMVETVAVIRNNIKEDAQSNDVGYSLFLGRRIDPATLHQTYLRDVVAKAHSENPRAYYSESAYARYPAVLIADSRMPLTALGRALQAAGFDVPFFNAVSRQASAKLLQLFILIGLLATLVSSRFVEGLFDTDRILLSVASLLFVAAQVVLPVLSTEYGVLRAFQQALFLLSVFMVIGSLTLLVKMSDAKKVFCAGALTILFFLSSTGVFTQLLGGYGAQLHLNNSGSYYDDYYLHSSEMTAAAWLIGRTVDPSRIQTNLALSRQFIPELSPRGKIYPGLIRRDSHVLLGAPTVRKGEARLSYEGTELSYAYPTAFLDTNKDRIYTSGDAEIYR